MDCNRVFHNIRDALWRKDVEPERNVIELAAFAIDFQLACGDSLLQRQFFRGAVTGLGQATYITGSEFNRRPVGRLGCDTNER